MVAWLVSETEVVDLLGWGGGFSVDFVLLGVRFTISLLSIRFWRCFLLACGMWVA